MSKLAVGPAPRGLSHQFRLLWSRFAREWPHLTEKNREALALYVEAKLAYLALTELPDPSPAVVMEIGKSGRALFKQAQELSKAPPAPPKQEAPKLTLEAQLDA